MRDTWEVVSSDTIRNSVNSAGFSFNHIDWHTVKHEIYGPMFDEGGEQQSGAGLDELDSSIFESEDDFFVVEHESDDD